ncbi:unnamed protein product [Gadus morhua 'NCC']
MHKMLIQPHSELCRVVRTAVDVEDGAGSQAHQCVKAAEDPPGSPWRTTIGLREVFGSTTVQNAFQRMKPTPHGSASGVHRTRNPET